MDSEQPLHLIEQLVPLLREKDFDEIFNRLTQNENTNGRFLLKMELKRKCTPCRRVIDKIGRASCRERVFLPV